MIAITRAPRLLVKVPVAPAKAGLRFGNNLVNAEFKPLFTSIREPTNGLAASSGAQWHVMSATESAGEVNAWDLCHHLVTQGFGVAGLSAPAFAEPDLAQQWITVTAVQHALAVTRTCDQPAGPDTRLPVGDGFFWFRDGKHSQLEAARSEVGQAANRVRIAHFDTGYDPKHETRPEFLLISGRSR
jgi:hypothetical protein